MGQALSGLIKVAFIERWPSYWVATIDRCTMLRKCKVAIECLHLYPLVVLEINIKEVDYTIEEGGSENPIIRGQFRRTQNDFTLNLYPVNIAVALNRYKLQAFLPATFTDLATEGVCVAHLQ